MTDHKSKLSTPVPISSLVNRVTFSDDDGKLTEARPFLLGHIFDPLLQTDPELYDQTIYYMPFWLEFLPGKNFRPDLRKKRIRKWQNLLDYYKLPRLHLTKLDGSPLKTYRATCERRRGATIGVMQVREGWLWTMFPLVGETYENL